MKRPDATHPGRELHVFDVRHLIRGTTPAAQRADLEDLAEAVQLLLPSPPAAHGAAPVGHGHLSVTAAPGELAWLRTVLDPAAPRPDVFVDLELTVLSVPAPVFERAVAPMLRDAPPTPLFTSRDASAQPVAGGTAATWTDPVAADALAKLAEAAGVSRLAQQAIRLAPLVRTGFLHGERLAYVRDFEVKITAIDAIADPVIGELTDGVEFDAVTSFGADGRPRLAFELSVTQVARPIPTSAATLQGRNQTPTLQLPEVTLTRVRDHRDLPENGVLLIDMTPRRLARAPANNGNSGADHTVAVARVRVNSRDSSPAQRGNKAQR